MEKRYVVMMNGVGGQGVLVAGRTLAKSAARVFNSVVFSPSYGTARRGGFSECLVSFSDTEISSPWLSRAQTVIVFEPSKLRACEPKVEPGGTIIVETTGLKEGLTRKDIRMVGVPAVETALSLGGSQMANVVLLGAYIQIAQCIAPEIVEAELQETFGAREKVAQNSIKAFNEGIRLATEAAG